MKKRKKKINNKTLLKCIGAFFAVGALSATLTPGLLKREETKGAESTEKLAAIRPIKKTTFDLSSMCPGIAFDKNLEEYLNSEFDCSNILGITSKDEIVSNKDAFVKITPILSKTKSVVLAFEPTTRLTTEDFLISDLILYDTENKVIPSSSYTITSTAAVAPSGTVHGVLTDGNTGTTVAIPRESTTVPSITVEFTNAVNFAKIAVVATKDTLNTKVSTLDSGGEILIPSALTSLSAKTNVIEGFDVFDNASTKQKLKSYVRDVTLTNGEDEKIPYFLNGSQFFIPSTTTEGYEDAKVCTSELDCSTTLQSSDEDKYINLNAESVLFVEGSASFEKISVVGQNIKVEVAHRRKQNQNPDSVTYQDVTLTAPTTGATLSNVDFGGDSSDELSMLACSSLLKQRLSWAFPKACDFLAQIWSGLGDDLKGTPVVKDLNLKGEYLSEYPLWDVQRVEFNSEEETSLTLDFKNFVSEQTTFEQNKFYYIQSLFKRSATTLDELTITGPITNTLSAAISEVRNLKKLTIDGSEITNYKFLSLLTSLEELTIINGNLENIEDLGAISQTLVKLNLSNNKISKVPASFLSSRSSLQELNLSNNMLSAIDTAALQGLTSLTTLNVSNNNLTALPDLSRNLTALSKLDASNNELTAIPSNIISMTTLRELKLSNNKLTTLPVATSANAIEVLDIRENPITAFGPIETNYTNLTSLSIGGSEYELNFGVTGAIQNLKTLLTNASSRLVELRVENMNLTTQTIIHLINHIGGLAGTPALRTLSFANNQSGNISNTDITNSPDFITNLDLSNQTTLNAIPLFITAMKNLHTLNISDNSIVVPQKITLPESLKVVDISKNPLSSIPRTIDTFKTLDKIIATDIDQVLGSEDWREIEEYIKTKKIELVLSESSFEPTELGTAKNFFNLNNLQVTLKSDDDLEEIDLAEQFLLNYETNISTQLKDQLKLKSFNREALLNYINPTQKVFYKRPAFDRENVNSEEKLDSYLNLIWEKSKPVAVEYQLNQAISEAEDAIEDTNKIKVESLADNPGLLAALVLVIIIFLANAILATFYVLKNRKKK